MSGYVGSKRSSSLVSFDEGTIGSDVVFPAGTIIGISQNQFNTEHSIYSTASNTFYAFTDPVTGTISNCRTGSQILISVYLHISIDETNRAAKFRLIDKTNSDAVIGSEGIGGLFGIYDTYAQWGGIPISYQILYTPPSFNSGSFQVELYGACDDPGETVYINNSVSGSTVREFSSNIILQEIAG
jgi:hypothetical protein